LRLAEMNDTRLDATQVRRYGRQILLDAVGGRGQRALLGAAVSAALPPTTTAAQRADRAATLVALAYLAGAGVGVLHLDGALDQAVSADDLGLLLHADSLGAPTGAAIAAAVGRRSPDVAVQLRSEPPPRARPLELGDHRAAGAALDGAARALWRGASAATAALAALLAGALEPGAASSPRSP
jgi:hypothetical protein